MLQPATLAKEWEGDSTQLPLPKATRIGWPWLFQCNKRILSTSNAASARWLGTPNTAACNGRGPLP